MDQTSEVSHNAVNRLASEANQGDRNMPLRVMNVGPIRDFFDVPLINFIAAEQHITRLEAANRLQQLATYLAVKVEAERLEPPRLFSPPKVLDDVWHLWMDRRSGSYTETCTRFFGGVASHTPMEVQPRGDDFFHLARRLELHLDPQYFGHPSSDYAPMDADCG